MVKKYKSVERTKKPKTSRKTEIIKNEKGSGNQNINQISVRIVDPTKSNKQKKKEESAERRKKKKLEAIEKLKEELSTFRQLKEEARIKNLSLPASLGETPTNINNVSSVKAVNLLIQEIEQRNLQIEQLLQSKQVDAPSDMMAGVFGSGGISGNNRIIPPQLGIPQQPAQPPAQPPAQQPQRPPPTTDFNRELQQISADLEQYKVKLTSLIDDANLKSKYPINDENILKIKKNISTAEDLDQELDTIVQNLNQLEDRTTNQRDLLTIKSIEDDYEFEIGEISISGIRDLSDKLEEYQIELNKWLKEANQPAQQPADQPAQQPADQPAQQPADQPAQQPADTTQQTLKEIRDEIMEELRKENKPIPDDIDQQAQKEFEEQQQEEQPSQKEEQPAPPPPQPQVSDSKIPPELQTEIDNVKRNSGDNNFNNRLQVLIEDTLREPNESNLDRLDKTTHRNIPTQADEYAIHDIFNKVSNIVKPQIQQQQQADIDTQQKREAINRERDEKSKQVQKDIQERIGEVEKLSGVKEAALNGRTVPKGWYNNYWLKYQELTKDIKDDIIENQGGIFQIPEDKLENIKQKKEQLKTDYTNFKNNLRRPQLAYMKVPTVAQYDSAIIQGLNSSIEDIIKIILNQEGKAVSKIVIGDIKDTDMIKATRERFVADGDFVNLLNRLDKQYKGTIEIKELREVNDKIEQAKSLATRTFRSLGEGEINVKSAYKDYLTKLKDLQLKVNQKILSTEKPPKFIYEMEAKLEPGEKIPADKGYIERTPEGKFLYHGRDTLNMIAQAERMDKARGGKLPEGVIDITGKKP